MKIISVHEAQNDACGFLLPGSIYDFRIRSKCSTPLPSGKNILQLCFHAHGFNPRGKNAVIVSRACRKNCHNPCHEVVGTTETICYTRSPKWVSLLEVEGFPYDEKKTFLVNVVDTSESLRDTIVTSLPIDTDTLRQSRFIRWDLENGRRLYLSVEPVSQLEHPPKNQNFSFQFSFKRLQTKKGNAHFVHARSFFEISRLRRSLKREWDVVHRSEIVSNGSNVIWNRDQIRITKLCNSLLDRPLKITVYCCESDGKYYIAGFFITSVKSIVKKFNDDSSNFFFMGWEKTITGKIEIVEAILFD